LKKNCVFYTFLNFLRNKNSVNKTLVAQIAFLSHSAMLEHDVGIGACMYVRLSVRHTLVTRQNDLTIVSHTLLGTLS